MPEPTTAAKTCTVCGIDCSGRQRVKDQQGRYMCQECFDRVKATKQVQKAPPPAPAGVLSVPDKQASVNMNDNSFLLDLGKESAGTAKMQTCPECGRPLTGNAVICIGCGYNLKTGKRLPVKVERAKKVKEKEGGGGGGLDIGGGMVALIFLAIYGLAFAGLFMGGGGLMSLAGVGVICLAALGVTIWAIVEGFKESPGWGIALIVGLFIPFIEIYFVFSVNDDERLKAAYGVTILASIAFKVMDVTGALPAFNP